MPTGGFLGFSPSPKATGNAGVNSIFLTSLVAQQDSRAVAFLLDAPSATGVTAIRALIYDSTHSALLASSAQVAAIAANYNRIVFSAPLSLTAGTTYYVGYACSVSTPVTIQSTGGPASWFASGGQSVASPANPLAAGAANPGSLMIALELDGTAAASFGYSLDQAMGVTLSASNTVATCPAGTIRTGARGIITHVTGDGKWYAEILVGGTINNGVGVGMATVNWGVIQGPGAGQAYTSFLLPTGSTASGLALGLGYVSGDVIGIAYDAINNLLWYNKNNGSWFGANSVAGNPSTGTGGGVVQSTLWPITLAVTTGAPATAAIFTLRDTAASLQFAPPSGFSAWSAAAAAVTGSNIYGRTYDVIYGRPRPMIYNAPTGARTYAVIMGRSFDVIYGRPFPGSL